MENEITNELIALGKNNSGFLEPLSQPLSTPKTANNQGLNMRKSYDNGSMDAGLSIAGLVPVTSRANKRIKRENLLSTVARRSRHSIFIKIKSELALPGYDLKAK